MVQSVARALALLERLELAGEDGLALGELARACELKAPTAHNLLETVAALGYAVQDPATRRYRLGPRAVALGRRHGFAEALTQAGRAAVAWLHRTVDETVVLASDWQGRRRTLLVAESGQALRVGASEGIDDRFTDTATGRCLLAQRAGASALVRHDGTQVVAFAVPIDGLGGDGLASLGLYLPAARCDAEREARLTAALTEAARRIGETYERTC